MIKCILRLRVRAQMATGGPPLGPTLGQVGIPAADFSKKFNDMSVIFEKGTWLSVLVKVYIDRTYSIHIKNPIFFHLYKENGSLSKGSPFPGYLHKNMYIMTNYMLYEYLKNFNKDSSFLPSYVGTLKSYGGLFLLC